MTTKRILDDLDALIKKASASKTAAVKEAGDVSSKLDNADDGESPATTGEQAAAQIKAQKEQYADPSVDTNASENPTGESVDMSSDEATAVDADGQEGTKGSEMASGGVGKADNGEETSQMPKNDGWDSGAFKGAAAELRKQAAELRKLAEASLSPLDRFLAKCARATDNEELRKHAQAMDDADLADAAASSLMEQIESGAIGDEEANAILQEASSAGAVQPGEIDAAAEAVNAVPQNDMMEAKLAAADIDPDHPEYLKKLASFYPAEIQAGYQFAMKLAEEMSDKDEDKGDEGEGKDDKGQSSKFEQNKEDLKDDGKLNDSNTKKAMPEGEESYEEEAKHKEMSYENGEEGGMPPAEASGEGDEKGDMSYEEDEGVMGEGSYDDENGGEVSEEAQAEGSLEDELTPASPEEEAALGAVGGELGLDEAALAQLMSAPLPPEAGAEIGKVAKALKTAGVAPERRYRTLILEKVAALRR